MSILFTEVRDALLDFTYRGIDISTTSQRWMGLASSYDELSGGGYARVRVDGLLTEPTKGQTTNASRILFPVPTGDWAIDSNAVTHVLLCEQEAEGNVLAAMPLAASLTIRAGDTVDITAGKFLGSVSKNLTVDWQNLLVNFLFRGIKATTTHERWLALFRESGEVAGPGYARVRIDDKLSMPVNGKINNSMVIAFPKAAGDWTGEGPITHLMICESATAGRLVCSVPLEYAVTMSADDTFRFEAGQLTLALDE